VSRLGCVEHRSWYHLTPPWDQPAYPCRCGPLCCRRACWSAVT
jgi:hypothetical protein